MIDLVEYIQNKAHYSMMGDVKGKVPIEILREFYAELNIDDFSLNKWNDAISYILEGSDNRLQFDSIDDVKNWIKTGSIKGGCLQKIDMSKVEEKFSSEILLCKCGTAEPLAKDNAIQILKQIYDRITEDESLFLYSIVRDLCDQRELSFDTRDEAARQIGRLVVKDIMKSVSQKQSSCTEVRTLVQGLLVILKGEILTEKKLDN